MPPAAVKTIKDLIFWQYAKIISKSAGFGINARAFQMKKFKELQSGKILWSTSVREWIKENEKPNECIYCGSKKDLTIEHILPLCRSGPDTPENVIKVCKKCNSSKGEKRLYEWFGLENKDKIPRVAEGKYLKLLYKLHEKNNTLDKRLLCDVCDMSEKCKKDGTYHKLSVYCLEGCFKKNK
ncbi:MAG: HNH endonuclease [Candidatus Aenigmatarchaeota archaeon]